MSTIPFDKQLLLANPVEQIEYKLAQREPVSGDELFHAIESSGHQLDDRLRDIIGRFSVSAVKRRGRPINCRGREDFSLEELDDRYPVLLLKYQGEAQERRRSAAKDGTILPVSERPPTELAYREILRDMPTDFPNIDWESLRNKHSAWKMGHVHPVEEDPTGPEDIEAEIDRLFPSVPES